MDSYMENPIKQNIRLKQYIGWFIAALFPFATRGILEVTGKPIVVAVIYWGICGVLLRYIIDRRLPYFHPQIGMVKKEIVFFVCSSVLIGYVYAIGGVNHYEINMRDLVGNIFLFAFLNGIFEPLIWANIFDLAGAKIKLNGFLAVFLYLVLIRVLFWGAFMPALAVNKNFFIFSQGLIFAIPLVIYMKTKDLTIWSIQYIMCNIIAVFLLGFGMRAFLYFK